MRLVSEAHVRSPTSSSPFCRPGMSLVRTWSHRARHHVPLPQPVASLGRRERTRFLLSREREFAPKSWTPNMDSNFFHPLFDALDDISVNRFANRAESPRESESHRGLVFRFRRCSLDSNVEHTPAIPIAPTDNVIHAYPSPPETRKPPSVKRGFRSFVCSGSSPESRTMNQMVNREDS